MNLCSPNYNKRKQHRGSEDKHTLDRYFELIMLEKQLQNIWQKLAVNC